MSQFDLGLLTLSRKQVAKQKKKRKKSSKNTPNRRQRTLLSYVPS